MPNVEPRYINTPDRVRPLPVPEGIVAGDPVLVGALRGVALRDRDDDAGTAAVALGAAWDLTVTGALAGAGAAVYITAGGALTATAKGNTLFGHTVPGATSDGSKPAGSGVVTVEITQA